ncbi:MAG: purine-nucleoside phosphorylase, partial [Campylobacter concisus]|nr:purine-nucleoside phosphorylase [Campylobacter concisus]
LAHKMFEKGYFLENMEFFSVLKVAQIFKIPAHGIFIATNFCDENAHADFIKNHSTAKELLTKYVKENM